VQDGWVMSIQVDDPDPGRLHGRHSLAPEPYCCMR
jgi:hypothetical protein